MPLNLTIITASTRPGRKGPAITDWVRGVAEAHGGFDVAVADLVDHALPLLDESAHPRLKAYQHDHTRRWSATVDAADAFLFVTPEYDYFPPASVVNAVQVLSQEWGYKPAGIVSYGGISGGLRATQSLRLLLGNINMVALMQSVPIPMVPQMIGEDGVFRPTDPVAQGATVVLDELLKWAKALQPMRAKA